MLVFWFVFGRSIKIGFVCIYLFMFWLHQAAFEMLVSPPGIEQWKCCILTTNYQGIPLETGSKSFFCLCCRLFIIIQLGMHVSVYVCVCDFSNLQLCDFSTMNHCVKGLRKDFTQRAVFLYNLFRESKMEAFLLFL